MNSKDKVKTIDFFAANPVFSLEEATLQLEVSRGRTGTVDRLKYYLKTGRLMLVTRGVYAVVPHAASAAGFIPDPFLVAVAMRKDAIFSHHSALELSGAAHSTWNRLTLYTGERRRPLVLKNGSIAFLSDPDTFTSKSCRYYGTKKVERRGRLLTVTGPERTLVEGFRRIAYSGGVEEFVTSASGFPVLDLEMLNTILHRYDSKNLWAAIGWFLERFRRVFHVEDSVLYEMEKHRPLSPCYLERDRRGGILVSRWNLILPEAAVKRNNNDEP
ncbi:MAG: hypothetical protein JW913_17945 [Chitinispirillaceae bacterium]|nr:hypothetical protein [Chitinispirillaceae bacterium]